MLQRRLAKIMLCSLAAFAIQPLWSPRSSFAAVKEPPKTVVVMGRPLILIESKGGDMGQSAYAGYIPETETPEAWTVMFAIRYAPGNNLDPKTVALATADKVKLRKASGKDPLANAGVFESKDGISSNVDFLVSTAKPQMLEHNVFRYFKVPGGIESYQIARRIYGKSYNQDKLSEFIKNIPNLRSKIFEDMARPDLPRWPR